MRAPGPREATAEERLTLLELELPGVAECLRDYMLGIDHRFRTLYADLYGLRAELAEVLTAARKKGKPHDALVEMSEMRSDAHGGDAESGDGVGGVSKVLFRRVGSGTGFVGERTGEAKTPKKEEPEEGSRR